MTYSVEINRTARKALDKTPAPYKSRIEDVIEDLGDNPRPHGCVKLETSDLYRIRVGDYRVVYSVDDRIRIVSITAIGNRRQIYKEL